MKRLSIVRRPQFCSTAWLAGAALSLGALSACAQTYVAPSYVPYPGDDFGFYFNGDLGPAFMADFQSPRFGFPGSFSTDTGLRFSAEPGYNFLAADWFTLGGEFETGVIYNRLSSTSAADSPLRGDYYQVPLLANLVLKLHPGPFLSPYVGVGGGGDCSWARLRSPGFFGYSNTHDRVDPALEAMAGVRFRFNPWCDAGLGYKFLAAFPGEGSSILTHAATASLTVRF